jgi:hypothetical protein
MIPLVADFVIYVLVLWQPHLESGLENQPGGLQKQTKIHQTGSADRPSFFSHPWSEAPLQVIITYHPALEPSIEKKKISVRIVIETLKENEKG